jgi:hypothetical protein
MQLELKELEMEIQEMNLIRNLRKWKHNTAKQSENCVIKTLKTENQDLQTEYHKFKQQLHHKGENAETDKGIR